MLTTDLTTKFPLVRTYAQSRWLRLGLLLLISLPALLIRLGSYPPMWFDEGYKTNAARTLAYQGVFGTYTVAGLVPFDPGISSGPADVIPTALSILAFGPGVEAMRLVSVVYALVALVCFYRIAELLYGARTAWVAAVLLLSFPNLEQIGFLHMSRQALGEPASVALILLGLGLWFRSWERPGWLLPVGAGLALGLGLLSKNQVGLALLPALAFTAAGRSVRHWRLDLREWLPVGLMLAVMLAWNLVGSLLTPPEIRADNLAMLQEALFSTLLPGLIGWPLLMVKWQVLAVAAAALIYFAVRLGRSRGQRWSNHQWAEACLALLVFILLVWVACLSIGWPRYFYLGWVVAFILAGKLVADLFDWVWPRVARRSLLMANLLPVLAGALAVFGYSTYYLMPAVAPSSDYQLQAAAQWIQVNIPEDAVVETWEWELDAVSGHWNMHHPHQAYLFLAIRQSFLHQRSFQFGYELLQADPDYLVIGPFAGWTQIYPQVQVTTWFEPVAQFGEYTIYQRQR